MHVYSASRAFPREEVLMKMFMKFSRRSFREQQSFNHVADKNLRLSHHNEGEIF